MIMSFWPTSLWVEENKKKGASEHEVEQGERGKERRRREGGRKRKRLQSKTKGEQTNASLLEKQDNRRRGRRRSRNRRWRGWGVFVVAGCCRRTSSLLASSFFVVFHRLKIWDSKAPFEVRGKTHRAKERAGFGGWWHGRGGGVHLKCWALWDAFWSYMLSNNNEFCRNKVGRDGAEEAWWSESRVEEVETRGGRSVDDQACYRRQITVEGCSSWSQHQAAGEEAPLYPYCIWPIYTSLFWVYLPFFLLYYFLLYNRKTLYICS